ncbi:uncharacterized protein LOC135847257 isoform X2 [Planococcus citri]|uniref:uncharacterized protein LOC135847257 isoform X2 n=2 Tax=Planococcus citri TaxID=170843 RepID=UPI0031F7377B
MLGIHICSVLVGRGFIVTMNLTFALLVLTLGLILVESNPSLSCLLFGKEGCHMECSITGELFNFTSRGICDSNQVCNCHNHKQATFHELWQQRFNSDYVFDTIRRSKRDYSKVFGIFRSNLFETNEELKQSLNSAISPYQFSLLETNDRIPAAKYTKNGKFDTVALRKYISKKLDEELKSLPGKSLLDVKYKEIFTKALEKDKSCKATVYNYTFKVQQLKNIYMKRILEEFFRKENMEKPEIQIPINSDKINTIVGNIVVSELINQIQKNSNEEILSDDTLNDEIEENSDVEIDKDVNPSISCILFGNEICNSVCVLYANMMNFQSRGMCDSNNLCICYNHRDRKISDSQLPNVKRTADGKFDETALVKYVTESVDENLKSSGKFLLDVNYEEKFKEALENAKDEENFVPEYNFKITQLKNKTLENMFEKFLKENKIKKTDAANPELPEEAITLLLVDNTIVNTVIERIDANRKVEIDKDGNPSMGCILFGNEVCNGICVLYGRLMNFQSSGECDSNNICTCYNQKDTPVSDSQRPSIKPTEKGQYNEKDLVKYITENVDRKLKSELGQSLLNIKYKDRFRKVLENSKNDDGFLFDYTFKVTQLENKILDNIFNEFLKENRMEKPDFGTIITAEEDWLIFQVDIIMLNTLIDRIEENSDVEIDKDVNPSISCLLFGNEICNSVCVLYANMMNFQSRGMCDSNNLCICYNHRDRKISDSQLPNVKRTADGKFDETALVKYVTESVDENLKSSGKFLLDVNYEEKFKEALENAKDEENFVPEYNFKITQLKNKTLENMFEKFLKENKIKKTDAANPELPEEAITLLLVDNTIVNTVIDRIDAKRNTEIDKDGNPSMSCILFGKEVCNGICVMHGRLLNFQSSGDCDSNNICTCYNRKDTQVSDSQRPSIKPTKKGRYNEKDLVKYLTENVDRKLKSELGQSLLNIKYKDRFRKALENSKNEGTFMFDYTFKVTQLKNKILENIFNEFLKENKMENRKPDFGTIISGEDDWLMDRVDNTIINTMIDRIEKQNQASPKSFMTKGKNRHAARAASAGIRKAAKKP